MPSRWTCKTCFIGILWGEQTHPESDCTSGRSPYERIRMTEACASCPLSTWQAHLTFSWDILSMMRTCLYHRKIRKVKECSRVSVGLQHRIVTTLPVLWSEQLPYTRPFSLETLIVQLPRPICKPLWNLCISQQFHSFREPWLI